MLQPGAQEVHFGVGGVEGGVAEQRPVEAAQRLAAERGHAAIDQAFVVVVAVGQHGARIGAKRGRQRRRDAD